LLPISATNDELLVQNPNLAKAGLSIGKSRATRKIRSYSRKAGLTGKRFLKKSEPAIAGP
jgi:hypothetical protein